MTVLFDLKYFYFLRDLVYMNCLLSEVLGQEGPPKPQLLKIKMSNFSLAGG